MYTQIANAVDGMTSISSNVSITSTKSTKSTKSVKSTIIPTSQTPPNTSFVTGMLVFMVKIEPLTLS